MSRNLDIRNIIKSQETLKSLVYLLVPEVEKRRLLRLQRRSIVLEPGSSSEDSEDTSPSTKILELTRIDETEYLVHSGKGDFGKCLDFSLSERNVLYFKTKATD